MHPGDVLHVSDATAGPGVTVQPLIRPEYFAEPLTLDALRIPEGASGEMIDAGADALAYVLDGHGVLRVGAGRHDLAPGYAFQVHAGNTWSIANASALTLLVFGVPAPVTPWAARLAAPISEVVDVAMLGAQASNAATGDRQYEVLFDRSRGSRGATMFVGFIPTSGAPEHYHLYDEICVIVRGSGTLHAGGRSQALGVGSAFQVAPRFLHALENPNPEDLWVLGVFRPEGSAAAAYYPDGTPAPNNED
ncbi:MAG: cupin domain-containing protein [Actinobacteria bacterium]|nr:cupin domain-containing protein [Actinomycetota bacterium]